MRATLEANTEDGEPLVVHLDDESFTIPGWFSLIVERDGKESVVLEAQTDEFLRALRLFVGDTPL